MANLSGLLIGIMITGLFVWGFSVVIGDLQTNYSPNLDNNVSEVFNNITSEYKTALELPVNASDENLKTQTSQTTDNGINPIKSLNSLKNMITGSLKVATIMIDQVQEKLQIDSMFKIVAIGILTLMFVIIFLAGVLKIGLG